MLWTTCVYYMYVIAYLELILYYVIKYISLFIETCEIIFTGLSALILMAMVF